MTEHKWTSGPWVWDKRRPCNIYCDDATGSIVATTHGFEYAPRREAEKQANAHLIAAAPEMYEALVAALKYVDFDGMTNAEDILIDNALAKAKGETQ